jgi:fatty acid amide hydrolase
MSPLAHTALTDLSASELAVAIARGDISATEAVEAHIERIEQVNPALNAVVVTRFAEARAEAQSADQRRARGEPLGPLHGVPVTIKECLDLEGTPSTFGLPARTRAIAREDDVYVARLRAAGAIVLGKTNVSQLLLYYESDNPVYGRSNNPWNLKRTPGGSSGGEAAIIAAGGSPLGLGTDIGGSLRIPATFCGIASLKPTTGRTPDAGRYSLPIGQRAVVSQVGVLARQVADVALGLAAINDVRTPAAEPPIPLGDPTSVDVSRLRVAYYTDDGTFPSAPAVRRGVLEAVDALKQAGAQVHEWSPPDASYAVDLFFGILSADGGQGMNTFLGRHKRDPRAGTLVSLGGRPRAQLALLGSVLRLLGQRRLAASLRSFGHRDTAHYWDLVAAQMDYQARFGQALDSDAGGGPFDLVLCPACPLPAFTHGGSRNLLTAGAYALLYNLLGYPAGVVPVTRVRPGEESGRTASRDVMERTARTVEMGSAGLPIGVQVVARPWREHVALAAMRSIETAASTRDDYPRTPTTVAD